MAFVVNLFVKENKGAPMSSVIKMNVTAGLGISKDKNANQISPRQILVTRKEDLDELNIKYGDLRENLIVDGLKKEDFRPGAVLHINNDVQIRLTFYCEPCKRIAEAVPSLKAVLYRRGILGVVISGGSILIDDNVIISLGKYKPFSDVPYERFLDFIKFIPNGKVVTYKSICIGIGVAESYIRAMPKYIEKAQIDGAGLPIHRIVDTAGGTIEKYIPNQLDLLKSEHIYVNQQSSLFITSCTYFVPLEIYEWAGESLYLS